MFLYLKDVVTLKIDAAKCVGCGFCLNVCPREVLEMRDGKATVAVKDACIECGACSKNCQFGAIDVKAGVGCATAILRGGDCCDPTCCCNSQSDKDKTKNSLFQR